MQLLFFGKEEKTESGGRSELGLLFADTAIFECADDSSGSSPSFINRFCLLYLCEIVSVCIIEKTSDPIVAYS